MLFFFFLIGFFRGLCYMDKAQRVVSQTSVQSSVGPWYLRRNQWGDSASVLVLVVVLHINLLFPGSGCQH